MTISRLITICSLLIFTIKVNAQNINKEYFLKFEIRNNKNELINNFRVLIKNANENVLQDTLLLRSVNLLKLKNVSPKENIEILFKVVGYEDEKRNIVLNDTEINLGLISFTRESIIQLDEISVKAIKKNIEFKADRSIYTLSKNDKDMYSSLTDILKKIPLISINPNEGIKMRGETGVKIYLNGKPTNINSLNALEFFKTIPVETIKKVEFISSTSAKFDAAGSSGIMNIITTNADEQGYFLSVAGSIGNRRSGVNSFYSFKKNKFSFNAFAGVNFNTKDGSQELTNSFLTDSKQLTQKNLGKRHNEESSPFFSFNSSYQIDTTSSLNFAANYYSYQFLNNLNSDITISNSNLLIEAYRLDNRNKRKLYGADFNLDYRKQFKDKSNLVISGQSFFNKENVNYLNQNSNLNFASNDFNNEKQLDNTIEIDFLKKINKVEIEVGTKAILRKNISSSEGNNIVNGTITPNNERFSELNYTQQIYAAYGNILVEHKNLSAQFGLRIENSGVKAKVPTNGQEFSNSNFNVFPSLSGNIKMPSNQNLNIKVNKKIQRPSVGILNPFLIQADPQNNSEGNTKVTPELLYNAEISYSKNFSSMYLLFSPYINYTKNSIRAIASAKETEKVINKYYNIGNEKSFGFTTYLSKSINDAFELSMSFDGIYSLLQGENEFKNLNNNGTSYRVAGNFGWKLPSDYSVSGSCTFNSSVIGPQGREAGYSFSDITLSKKFLSKKLSANIILSDFIPQNGKLKSYYETAQLRRYESFQYKTTALSISLSYDFGLSKYINNTRKKISNNDLKKAE